MSAGVETWLLQCVLVSRIFRYPARAVVPRLEKLQSFMDLLAVPSNLGNQ